MEYIHLVGAEQVQHAASAMREASSNIQHAASSLDHTLTFTLRNILEDHQRFMDVWLERFERVIASNTKTLVEQPRGYREPEPQTPIPVPSAYPDDDIPF